MNPVQPKSAVAPSPEEMINPESLEQGALRESEKTRTVCHLTGCNKKLKTVETIKNFCRCGYWFCNQHIWYKDHGCTFDYQRRQSAQLTRKMPVVKKRKVEPL